MKNILFGAESRLAQPKFLPMSRGEMEALGWDGLDVLLISGDAYLDHPACGIALLGRLLIAHGFRTAIIAQPNWKDLTDVSALGRPRLFAGIGAGAVDSMLAEYTAFRQRRDKDSYSPGGRMGLRPHRASIVYANLVRRAFPKLPIVLGGIEASTRRCTHYDFWADALRKPMLLDSKADLLAYGMGERSILEIASALNEGSELIGIAGTCWKSALAEHFPIRVPQSYRRENCVLFPSHERIVENKDCLMELALKQEAHVHARELWAMEEVDGQAVVFAEPSAKLSTEEMDALYGLPFARSAHPSYKEPIPAEEMLKTSITSHRGCGGGCSFCSLALHQGRRISSRSKESILSEAKLLIAQNPPSRRKKGVSISDVGGPTANMWGGSCTLARKREEGCKRKSCCTPTLCPFFHTAPKEHVELLRSIAQLSGIAQVRVASGVRADIALHDPESLDCYIREFTGGQLKLAPEHSEDAVLRFMRKPPMHVFEEFLRHFMQVSKALGKEQYIVPYLMSAHPGSTLAHMEKLRLWLKKRHWSPKQTQCFIPTPGTVATAMFYTAKDEQGRDIFVARSDHERRAQHALLLGQRAQVQEKGKGICARKEKRTPKQCKKGVDGS